MPARESRHPVTVEESLVGELSRNVTRAELYPALRYYRRKEPWLGDRLAIPSVDAQGG
jgi:hypothetical protein